MPIDNQLTLQTWTRYQYCRDNGHTEFIRKAEQCENFFRGLQWNDADLSKLNSQRRPH